MANEIIEQQLNRWLNKHAQQYQSISNHAIQAKINKKYQHQIFGANSLHPIYYLLPFSRIFTFSFRFFNVYTFYMHACFFYSSLYLFLNIVLAIYVWYSDSSIYQLYMRTTKASCLSLNIYLSIGTVLTSFSLIYHELFYNNYFGVHKRDKPNISNSTKANAKYHNTVGTLLFCNFIHCKRSVEYKNKYKQVCVIY